MALENHQQNFDELAKPLTLDQAFSQAYRRMRDIVKTIEETEPHGQYWGPARKAIEEILQRDLQRIFYGPELAALLARPGDVPPV